MAKKVELLVVPFCMPGSKVKRYALGRRVDGHLFEFVDRKTGELTLGGPWAMRLFGHTYCRSHEARKQRPKVEARAHAVSTTGRCHRLLREDGGVLWLVGRELPDGNWQVPRERFTRTGEGPQFSTGSPGLMLTEGYVHTNTRTAGNRASYAFKAPVV